MTDRVKGLIVALDTDIRDDDVQEIIHAIKMLKHVENVTMSKSKGDDWMLRNKIKAELRDKFMALWEELGR